MVEKGEGERGYKSAPRTEKTSVLLCFSIADAVKAILLLRKLKRESAIPKRKGKL